jgi:hypothetical protein
MLRHFQKHQLYWFCRNCWQEMPLLEGKAISLATKPFVDPLIPLVSCTSVVKQLSYRGATYVKQLSL